MCVVKVADFCVLCLQRKELVFAPPWRDVKRKSRSGLEAAFVEIWENIQFYSFSEGRLTRSMFFPSFALCVSCDETGKSDGFRGATNLSFNRIRSFVLFDCFLFCCGSGRKINFWGEAAFDWRLHFPECDWFVASLCVVTWSLAIWAVMVVCTWLLRLARLMCSQRICLISIEAVRIVEVAIWVWCALAPSLRGYRCLRALELLEFVQFGFWQ